MTSPYSRSPKQQRSRDSFKRVLDSAAKLLAQKGYEGFNLIDVSKRSKISIGSIYGRVASKDDLLRAVQEHVLAEVDKDHDRWTESNLWQGQSLAEILPMIVADYGDFLKKHAGVFRAFISRASVDPVIRTRGKRSQARFNERLGSLLLQHRSEIGHRDPERAVLFVCHALWSIFEAYLGIGTLEFAGEGDWNELVSEQSRMYLLYLQAAQARSSPGKLSRLAGSGGRVAKKSGMAIKRTPGRTRARASTKI